MLVMPIIVRIQPTSHPNLRRCPQPCQVNGYAFQPTGTRMLDSLCDVHLLFVTAHAMPLSFRYHSSHTGLRLEDRLESKMVSMRGESLFSCSWSWRRLFFFCRGCHLDSFPRDDIGVEIADCRRELRRFLLGGEGPCRVVCCRFGDSDGCGVEVKYCGRGVALIAVYSSPSGSLASLSEGTGLGSGFRYTVCGWQLHTDSASTHAL